jgi:hypothetical protein
MVKPVDTKVVEELRVFGTPDENGAVKEWLTPEFVSLVGTVTVNLITAATVVGLLDGASAQELTKASTAIIAAVSTISVNGLVVWKYLSARAAVKTEQIAGQFRYAETIAMERMRAERSTSKRFTSK